MEKGNLESAAPLAVRMRPRNLREFIGQSHFLGPGKLLTRMLQADRLSSLIFCGPPGVGKTSLAMIIAGQTQARFHSLSAPAATVKDIREVIAAAKDRLATGAGKTVLFLDEIHRFNRAQQDVLLGDVESGILTLIGATTENPYFSINGPLISRSTVFRFEPLTYDETLQLLRRACVDSERGLGRWNVQVEDAALAFLAERADGDARKALTALEVGVLSQGHEAAGGPIKFHLETAKESIQQRAVLYDGTGDTHYDLASALHMPLWTVGFGYRYIERGDILEDLNLDYGDLICTTDTSGCHHSQAGYAYPVVIDRRPFAAGQKKCRRRKKGPC